MTKEVTALLSCLKVGEGGQLSQRQAIELLRLDGIWARPAHSPYMGYYGIEVPFRSRKRAAFVLWHR